MTALGELTKGKKFRELYELYKKIRSGEIRVVDPNPPRDFYEYLTRPDYSAWFWTGVAFVALTIISIPLSHLNEIILYLRYILGSLFVLFLPGYYTIEALYPSEEELSDLERLALSIGLSLALVPLIGLILNYTPWGIRLWPVVYSLAFYMVLLAIIAAYRKYLIIRKTLT